MATQTATVMPDSQNADLMARIACLEAEARQRDEDHMMHVMELSGRMRELVQSLDASEADASRTRAQLMERERQLEKRSSFEAESLNISGGSSSEDLCTRLVAVEARSAEQELERRACEEEHAAREAELTGHIRDLAKRGDYAEAELGKLRKQFESERAQHIHLQVEREGLVKSLREQLDALSRENFRLSSDLDRCMEELRKMTSERPLFWDRRLVTQGLAVYFQQRDPATRADVLARLADTLEFTPEERQRLGVVRKLSRREQELADIAQARDKRRAFTDLADQFIRFISAEVDEPSTCQAAAAAPSVASALTVCSEREKGSGLSEAFPITGSTSVGEGSPIVKVAANVVPLTALISNGGEGSPIVKVAANGVPLTALISPTEGDRGLDSLSATCNSAGLDTGRESLSTTCTSVAEPLHHNSEHAAAHPFLPDAGEL